MYTYYYYYLIVVVGRIARSLSNSSIYSGRVRPAPMKFRRVQVLKVQTGRSTAYKLSTDRNRIQILGVHSRRQIAIVILIGRFLAINRYRRYHLVYEVVPRIRGGTAYTY